MLILCNNKVRPKFKYLGSESDTFLKGFFLEREDFLFQIPDNVMLDLVPLEMGHHQDAKEQLAFLLSSSPLLWTQQRLRSLPPDQLF